MDKPTFNVLLNIATIIDEDPEFAELILTDDVTEFLIHRFADMSEDLQSEMTRITESEGIARPTRASSLLDIAECMSIVTSATLVLTSISMRHNILRRKD